MRSKSSAPLRVVIAAIANSERPFRLSAPKAELGIVPGAEQCIAFDIPVVFKESANASHYVANIYDYIGFLGDVHRQ